MSGSTSVIMLIIVIIITVVVDHVDISALLRVPQQGSGGVPGPAPTTLALAMNQELLVLLQPELPGRVCSRAHPINPDQLLASCFLPHSCSGHLGGPPAVSVASRALAAER